MRKQCHPTHNGLLPPPAADKSRPLKRVYGKGVPTREAETYIIEYEDTHDR